jgi:hypothetical protein
MRLGAPVLRIVRSEDVSKPGVGRRAICDHARALHGACRNRRPCRFSAWGAPVAPLRGEDLGRRRQDATAHVARVPSGALWDAGTVSSIGRLPPDQIDDQRRGC